MMFNSLQDMFTAYERAVRSRYEARKAGHKEDARHFGEQATFLEKRIHRRVQGVQKR